MLQLSTLLSGICDDTRYRFHMAKPNSSGIRPLDVFAKSSADWLYWQTYRGKKKERFIKEGIVSFAQISGNKFLFGGVFGITNRDCERYKVERSEEHSDLIGRLVVEYTGGNARVTVFKPSEVLSNSIVKGIYEQEFQGEKFINYEQINHDFGSLEVIVRNELADWKSALSSIYGIYLLTDKKEGKSYVGSASGQDGLWGRWLSYITTFHGNNKELKTLFRDRTEEYFRKNFKFSILEILPPITHKDEVIRKEALWKRKLLTFEHGYNGN